MSKVPTEVGQKAASKRPVVAPSRAEGDPSIASEQREQMIAVAAYYRAERRGFQGGDPRQDWLEAEAEIDRILDAKMH